ncbi:MAG TPA: efflux RND transporter periplasmic adaptor subunit [Opitutaceae bacterium]|nr:efflux RND transporter periplasmic adaptor subunit [Opitutaceae bacterium]
MLPPPRFQLAVVLRRARRAAGPAALAFLLLAAGCGRSRTGVGLGPPAVPVQIGRAVRQTLPITQAAIGTVQTLRTVTVKSQVDGVIESIHFREGQDVQAGDLLAALDHRPFENALRMARADLANARAQAANAQVEAERYQRLDRQQAISKEQLAQLLTDVETTKAQVQSREAAVANAELQLSYTEIRAPIAGRTGQLCLHEGALVKANDAAFPLVTINQVAPIAVAYAVPEGSLAGLRAALAAGPVAVTATPHDGAGRSVAGRLDFIDNAVDPATGTILLKAVFANADHALWPGQFVDIVTRIGEEADIVLVPAAAVQTGQQGSQVFVMKPDRTVELRPVTTGPSANGLTVIRAGVQAGETVVTDGQVRLVPGARVEPRTLAGPDDGVAAVPAAAAAAGGS